LILSLVLDGVVVAIELLGLALKVVFHVVFELLDQPQAIVEVVLEDGHFPLVLGLGSTLQDGYDYGSGRSSRRCAVTNKRFKINV